MSRTADVVIIGGGIQGASIAYHLTQRGHRHVVILEKETLASGCSGRTGGMIRQHYSSDLVTEIARQGRDFFATFDEVVGGHSGWVQCGLVYMVTEKDREALHHNVALGQRHGVPTGLVDAEEARRRVPGLNTEGAVAFSQESNVGYAFSMMKPRYQRKLSVDQTIEELRPKVAQVPGVMTFLQNPPPITINGQFTTSVYQMTLQSVSLNDIYDWTPKLTQKIQMLPGFISRSGTDARGPTPDVLGSRVFKHGLICSRHEGRSVIDSDHRDQECLRGCSDPVKLHVRRDAEQRQRRSPERPPEQQQNPEQSAGPGEPLAEGCGPPASND